MDHVAHVRAVDAHAEGDGGDDHVELLFDEPVLGRAGRDGLEAECVLLFSASDLATHRFLAQKDGNLGPERQKALERQLREIGRFAVAPLCRHRILTEHFDAPYAAAGETGCGACDVCLGETKGLTEADALVTAQKVLSAAWRTNGRYGAGYVVNLLMGRADERMTRNEHDKLQVFGLLKEAGEATVRAWMDQLIVQDYLEVVEDGMYPLLRITDLGKALCKGEGTVRLGIPAPPRAKKGKKPKALRAAADAGAPADEALFERLRRLRRMIADQLGVPPYIVFHDSALVEMAAAKPSTLAELGEVKGVGAKKLERYGSAFLSVLNGGQSSGLLT